MGGVRLASPYHSATVIVRHPRKDYHLRFGADGTTIVSGTVWGHLRQLDLGDIRLCNEVGKPPPQSVSMHDQGDGEVVAVVLRHRALRSISLVINHPRKDYHLNLDGEGRVAVSPVIWERLQEIGGRNSFEEVGAVRAPGTQKATLKIDGRPVRFRVEQHRR